MVTASRRPRLRPWAPIGGNRWAASPTSAMRLAAKRGAGKRAKALGFVRGDDADEARTRTGQGNQGERPLGGVEFGRDVVVRTRMGEGEGESGLRVGTTVQRDAGGSAADRVAPVGPDGELAI